MSLYSIKLELLLLGTGNTDRIYRHVTPHYHGLQQAALGLRAISVQLVTSNDSNSRGRSGSCISDEWELDGISLLWNETTYLLTCNNKRNLVTNIPTHSAKNSIEHQ